MIELKSGEKIVRARANVLARMYYQQEFNKDLDEDLQKIRSYKSDTVFSILDGEKIDTKLLLSLVKDMEEIKKVEEEEKEEDENGSEGKNENIENMTFKMMEKINESGINIDNFMKLTTVQNQNKYPALPASRIVWAMAKAQGVADGYSVTAFEKWIIEYADFDVNDCLEDFEDEINRGFFRNTKK